ncbi:GNAT family N-acetyltransferase [Altererythrobacter endophyticus]|uniref:GNAT family N-acetyltransferase n=2 Tax=Altericroceibacterium endophyticum TaxID=1808508 RepID=A0A6I4T519_9SPHN|nr:GNAT family N-acetyltransferase [Altericroceibacterium endophyticum]MXO65000.1 GNAT family N-acetyltransferase [Altericroceibacterium endophyticum]
MITICEDDLSGDAVRDLLRLHMAAMEGNSPAGSVFALDLSGLQAREITVWTAWEGDRIAGIGALKEHSGELGEIKSMRTHPDFLRRGVAAALLDHIIDQVRARGLARLALETGSGDAFEPALALYRRRGFTPCEAFGDYTASAFNQFFEYRLSD